MPAILYEGMYGDASHQKMTDIGWARCRQEPAVWMTCRRHAASMQHRPVPAWHLPLPASGSPLTATATAETASPPVPPRGTKPCAVMHASPAQAPLLIALPCARAHFPHLSVGRPQQSPILRFWRHRRHRLARALVDQHRMALAGREQAPLAPLAQGHNDRKQASALWREYVLLIGRAIGGIRMPASTSLRSRSAKMFLRRIGQRDKVHRSRASEGTPQVEPELRPRRRPAVYLLNEAIAVQFWRSCFV